MLNLGTSLNNQKLGPFDMRESYSQYNQDVFVGCILNRTSSGIFLDVGARDGIINSNTYLLEKKYGWTGLAIEAHPDLYEQARDKRSCSVVNCAISNSEAHKMEFVKLLEEPFGNSGLLQTYPHKKHLETKKHEIIDVEVRRLDDLLQEHRLDRIDYLDLDIEGAEFAALQTIDFNKVDISVIAVECQPSIENENTNRIINLLYKHDFSSFARMGSDLFFSRDPNILYQTTEKFG